MPRPRKKIKLTWTELRQQRNALERFELYLPILQLKQQQLQLAILHARQEHLQMRKAADAMKPEEGQIVLKTRVVNDYFKAVHKDDGSVEYVHIKTDGGQSEYE